MRDTFLEQDSIERRASEWVLRRDRDGWTPQDQAELETWLSRDSRHREAYRRRVELWKLAEGLKVWRPADGSVNLEVLAPMARNGRTRLWPFALAAALILSLVMGAIADLRGGRGTYVTRVGGYQRLLLEDGSVLQLNTDSKVRVRLSRQRREVQLLRGEAYFDVAQEEKRPFVVVAGETVVRALGTAFSVRLQDAEKVEVLVAQGRVAVQESAGSGLVAGVVPAKAVSVLEAGQVAEARPNGVRRVEVGSAELSRRLAWQTGVLHFKDMALGQVVAEFNRYNRRQLVIADPRIENLEVGGSFKADDLESFVAAMRGVRGIRVEESGDRVVLSGDGVGGVGNERGLRQ